MKALGTQQPQEMASGVDNVTGKPAQLCHRGAARLTPCLSEQGNREGMMALSSRVLFPNSAQNLHVLVGFLQRRLSAGSAQP